MSKNVVVLATPLFNLKSEVPFRVEKANMALALELLARNLLISYVNMGDKAIL